MSNFGDTLATFREAQHLSRSMLASRVGIDVSYISRLESGQRDPPTLPIISQLAGVLCKSETQRSHFYGAAGYAPPGIRDVWNEDMAHLIRAIADTPFEARGPLCKALLATARGWNTTRE